MVSFYALSFFPILKGSGEALQQFILANFVADSASVIAQYLNTFLQQIRVLSWTSFLSLGFVSLLMIYNMVRAFNKIWHVKLRRYVALSFVIYLLILLATPLFFGVLMLVSSYLASLPLISGTKASLFIKKPVLVVLPYLSAFITFSFFNWVLPSTRVRVWHAVIAGFITTFLFELAKYLFTFYLTYFPTYRLIYGALATILIFLIWIYVTWSIILLGALICSGFSSGFKTNP